METVSVIIPSYNSARTVARAVESVLAQTRPADEIIVVDDGSSDDTADLVRRRFPQVIYHYQENAGLAATRNAGARLARGSVLGLLDADDEWVPTKLERQLAVLDRRPDLGAVGCHRIRIAEDAEGRELSRTPSRHADGGLDELDFAQEFWSNRVCGASVLFRREVFEGLGGYDASFRACEDMDMWLRLLGAGHKLAVLREALYIFYDHPGSLRSRLDLLEDSWVKILGKWDPGTQPEARPLLSARDYETMCKWWWLKLTFHALRYGESARARDYARRAAGYREQQAGAGAGGGRGAVLAGALRAHREDKGFPAAYRLTAEGGGDGGLVDGRSRSG